MKKKFTKINFAIILLFFSITAPSLVRVRTNQSEWVFWKLLVLKTTAIPCNGIKVFAVNTYTHPQKAALKFSRDENIFQHRRWTRPACRMSACIDSPFPGSCPHEPVWMSVSENYWFWKQRQSHTTESKFSLSIHKPIRKRPH